MEERRSGGCGCMRPDSSIFLMSEEGSCAGTASYQQLGQMRGKEIQAFSYHPVSMTRREVQQRLNLEEETLLRIASDRSRTGQLSQHILKHRRDSPCRAHTNICLSANKRGMWDDQRPQSPG